VRVFLVYYRDDLVAEQLGVLLLISGDYRARVAAEPFEVALHIRLAVIKGGAPVDRVFAYQLVQRLLVRDGADRAVYRREHLYHKVIKMMLARLVSDEAEELVKLVLRADLQQLFELVDRLFDRVELADARMLLVGDRAY